MQFTVSDFARMLLLPLVVSSLGAAVGRWRVWPWCAPLSAGMGFLAGFAAMGVPKLPPDDGTEWLFWLAVPLTVLGVTIAKYGGRWGWLLGWAVGGVSYGIARPLVSVGSATWTAVAALAVGFGVAGVVLSAATRVSAARAGAWAAGTAWAIVVGAAAVVVMSSNSLSVGKVGLAAAAALGPAGVLGPPKLRGFGPVATGLLAGVLTGGRLYAEPGVTAWQIVVLTLAPLLLAFAAFLPARRRWVRGVVGVSLVTAAVAAVAVPAAVAAKRAADANRHADAYGY